MVTVEMKDMVVAFDRWREVASEDYTSKFWRFLGCRPRIDEDGNYVVTDRGYRKIQMLLSPHWETLLKVHKVRKQRGRLE